MQGAQKVIDMQLKTIFPLLMGGFIALIGVAFLISLTIPRFGRAMLGRLAPDQFTVDRMRRFSFIRTLSLSLMYILFGISIALLAIPNLPLAWVFIALGTLCLICVLIFQHLIRNEARSRSI